MALAQVANTTNEKLLERLDAQETEQAAVKAAVSAITRLWEELNADIGLLALRLPRQVCHGPRRLQRLETHDTEAVANYVRVQAVSGTQAVLRMQSSIGERGMFCPPMCTVLGSACMTPRDGHPFEGHSPDTICSRHQSHHAEHAVRKQENGAAAKLEAPVKAEADSGGASPADGQAGAAHEDGPACDPFLRAMTRGGDPKALKLFAGSQAELDAKATDAERALRRRADATKAALAALLQRVDAERQRFESRLANAAPAEAAEELRRCALASPEPRPCGLLQLHNPRRHAIIRMQLFTVT